MQPRPLAPSQFDKFVIASVILKVIRSFLLCTRFLDSKHRSYFSMCIYLSV